MMTGLDEQTKGAIIDHQNDEDYWMEYRQGNILNEFDLDYIVHQCNCFHCMGGGVAYALSKTWPKVYEVDNETEYGSKDKMGTYSVAKIKRPVELNGEIVEHELNVINIYSQYEPGMAESDDEIEFSKECLKKAFIQLKEDIITRAESCILENRKYLVGIPWMIGCGIYGMNVNEIFELIRDIFYDYSHVIRIVFVDYN